MAHTALALLCIAGCATARNYTDPSGPVLIGSVASPARAPAELRVVSFNVQFARHVDRAIALLNRAGPLKEADVLVLQEMDEPGTAALARALGMNHVYVPSAVHPSSRRDFGVAILSPWPLEDARKVLLPHRHRFRKMRRSAAAATVRTPLGAVRVVAVHLETVFGGSARVRRDQARAVAAQEAAWTGPIVIAGDFNGTGAARELAHLGFTWLTRDVHDTAGPFDLDHIVVRGLCPTRVPPAATAADPLKASDHLPVWTTLVPCRAPHGSGQTSENIAGIGSRPRLVDADHELTIPRGREHEASLERSPVQGLGVDALHTKMEDVRAVGNTNDLEARVSLKPGDHGLGIGNRFGVTSRELVEEMIGNGSERPHLV